MKNRFSFFCLHLMSSKFQKIDTKKCDIYFFCHYLPELSFLIRMHGCIFELRRWYKTINPIILIQVPNHRIRFKEQPLELSLGTPALLSVASWAFSLAKKNVGNAEEWMSHRGRHTVCCSLNPWCFLLVSLPIWKINLFITSMWFKKLRINPKYHKKDVSRIPLMVG